MIFHQIWKPFIHKEKILIILAIFIFMNISLWFTFQQSIFSEAGYETVYPNAGLEFFIIFMQLESMLIILFV